MNKAKNKYSKKIHTVKTRLPKNSSTNPMKKIIITVIILAFITVAIGVIFIPFSKPEYKINTKIPALASDYYENYFYEELLNLDQYSNESDLKKAMTKYEEKGFAIVTLRQLLLHHDEVSSEPLNYLKEYCDENATFVRFYPEYPYEKTSYHIDYNYSCDY